MRSGSSRRCCPGRESGTGGHGRIYFLPQLLQSPCRTRVGRRPEGTTEQKTGASRIQKSGPRIRQGQHQPKPDGEVEVIGLRPVAVSAARAPLSIVPGAAAHDSQTGSVQGLPTIAGVVRVSEVGAHEVVLAYETRPLCCPRCHGEIRLIAFLTEPASIRALLAHLGEPTTPPALAPRARAELSLRSDPELINHPSALLLLRRGCPILRHAAGNGKVAATSSGPPSSLTVPSRRQPRSPPFRRLDNRKQANRASRAQPKHAHPCPPHDRNWRLDVVSFRSTRA
jgi:hypothetical protein